MDNLKNRQANKENGFFNRLIIWSWLILIFGIASTVWAQQDADIFPVPTAYQTEGIPQIKKSEVENLFYDPSMIRSNLIWDANGKNKRLLITDETNNVYLLVWVCEWCFCSVQIRRKCSSIGEFVADDFASRADNC